MITVTVESGLCIEPWNVRALRLCNSNSVHAVTWHPDMQKWRSKCGKWIKANDRVVIYQEASCSACGR